MQLRFVARAHSDRGTRRLQESCWLSVFRAGEAGQLLLQKSEPANYAASGVVAGVVAGAGAAAGAAAGALAAIRALFKRALRRFAALRWMMPRFAALSTAEINSRTPVASAVPVPLETCLCILRRRVSTLRLRSERRAVWRARLPADFVLAMR